MAKRAEAFILRQQDCGLRVHPITFDEAEALVKKGDASVVRRGLYRGTKKGSDPKQDTRMLTSPKTKSQRKK